MIYPSIRIEGAILSPDTANSAGFLRLCGIGRFCRADHIVFTTGCKGRLPDNQTTRKSDQRRLVGLSGHLLSVDSRQLEIKLKVCFLDR